MSRESVAMRPTPTSDVPALPAVRGRRRPWVIATGALLASLGALAVIWLVGEAGQRHEVLLVRQEVPYGRMLTADDVTVARVSLDPGVSSWPAADREGVPGMVAATRLVPGMLLAPEMVEPSGAPGAGQVLVPIALPSERMPAGGLRAGDRILAVDAGGPTDDPDTAVGPVRWVPATVVRVGPADINGVTVVDVTATPADGPGLALLAANARVAVVVQPSGA
jgi:hypothetical protein